MNEQDEFTHVQRRLCAVIAKSEWTSSRMRMQKSGEELRESRAKSNRTANQFLQDLLGKRTDSDLIDDNGAVDRYHKFMKCKSGLNDDSNSTLDEFNRRLRALNNNRENQIKKVNNILLHRMNEKNQQENNHYSQSSETNDVQNDKKDILLQSKPLRILPTVTTIPITSTPNDTTNEITTSVFQDDEIRELSKVESTSISSIDSQANHIESSIEEQSSKCLAKIETLNASTPSLTQPVHVPTPRRSDGTEIIHSSSSKLSLAHESSNILLFNHCHFPRALTSRGKLQTNLIPKRQLPSLPIVQKSEEKQYSIEEVYDLLDHLDNHSSVHFTDKLNRLTLSTVIQHHHEKINEMINQEDLEEENEEYSEEKENSFLNLFEQIPTINQEKLFYSTLDLNIDDPKTLSLYTMTLGTVQLSASILLPYSILTGRRPLLKCSRQTSFKRIHSKQPKYTCQVTAIESCSPSKQLQSNDIILKIDDQSVWNLSTESIIEMLKKVPRCSLTIVRLCQPFI